MFVVDQLKSDPEVNQNKVLVEGHLVTGEIKITR